MKSVVARQRLHHHVAELARLRRALRKLQVVLHLGRLMAGGDAAVDPRRFLHDVTATRDLLRRQHLWYMNHHASRVFSRYQRVR